MQHTERLVFGDIIVLVSSSPRPVVYPDIVNTILANCICG